LSKRDSDINLAIEEIAKSYRLYKRILIDHENGGDYPTSEIDVASKITGKIEWVVSCLDEDHALIIEKDVINRYSNNRTIALSRSSYYRKLKDAYKSFLSELNK